MRQRPDFQARLAFAELLAPSHPYATSIVGDPERIRAITRADLIGWHKDRIAREGLHITVVVDMEKEAMAELVDSLFEGLPARGKVPEIPDLTARVASSEPQHVSVANSAQAIVVSGGLTINAKNPEAWLAAGRLNMILSSGRKSRLFRTVRKETGKSYGFNPMLLPYSKTGVFAVFGMVDKSGLADTVTTVRETIMRFREEGPNASEIADVKAFTSANNAKTEQNHIQMANGIRNFSTFGWSLESIRRVKDIAQSIDLTDPKFRKALIPENPVILIVE